ncbi:hypothetical protein [Aristaeella lactis]|uniref:Uncharacterized protein n=1 Tax=Aristaeella lactis TaxID=3046383 RepID=A0AC61PLA5_9FIRM|nr:hypothetical protein [Aristaeella lactis]QUA52200.1 hypothetical protein JYE50_10795 [Aristaeella lactis]SMC58781.1 hypothetical protein SAMN06297397_1580 [Aristaeella lactis]
MTSLATILLKELKKKHIISDIDKESERVIYETITFNKPGDLHIRDAIFGMGTILKEDLDNHYYITSVKTGLFNNVLAYAIIQRNEEGTADIAVYAKEGIIKQNLARKALERIQKALQ